MAELLGAVGDVKVVGVQELAGVGKRLNVQPLTEVGGFVYWTSGVQLSLLSLNELLGQVGHEAASSRFE